MGEPASLSGLTRTNLSQRAAAVLVGRRREETTVYYRIVDESLGELCGLVCASLWEKGRALAVS
jgi:hypothetical protein